MINKAILESLILEGLSSYGIARQLNVSQTTIRHWLKKYKLKTLRSYHTNKVCRCGKRLTENNTYSIRRYECKDCFNSRSKKRSQRIKRIWIEYKGGKCIRCGYNKCIAALAFHHRDLNNKDPKWESMKHWSFDKVKFELDKCDLVCHNCHAEIHYGK